MAGVAPTFYQIPKQVVLEGKTTKPRCRPPKEPKEEQSILWEQYSGDSGLGNNRTLRFISKEEAIERLREIHSSPSGVCKVLASIA